MNTPPSTPHGEGIYVASRVKHAELWKKYRAAGTPIIASWIDEAGEGETADFGELWQRIRSEIGAARALVFYAAGVQDFPFKGALVEVGIALAMGKPVYAVLNDVMIEGRTLRPVGSWLLDRNVKRYEDLDDALIAASLVPIAPTPDWVKELDDMRYAADCPSGGAKEYKEYHDTLEYHHRKGHFAASETRGSDETGWLIENAERLYLTTDATGFFAWTKDNLDAIRFCRRQDAEKVASGNDDAWHVVEHMWSDPAPIEKMNVNTEKRGKP